MSTHEIKNGDIYLRDGNQIIIIHGECPILSPQERCISAVFGSGYSGCFGRSDKYSVYASDILSGSPKYTYLGNLSDIFKGILKL